MSRVLTFAILLAAATAIAKPRIAVLPFSGPKANKVKLQISKKLCARFTCITPQKGSSKKVDAVVVGTVTKKDLQLKIYLDEDAAPVTVSMKVGPGGKLNAKALARAPSVVKKAIKSAQEEDSAVEGGARGAQP